MNKLMIAIAVCLAGAAVSAAQCQGITLAGERCKREAAEGSKFCIGHADQAKKPAAAAKDAAKEAAKDAKAEPREKDDGTCWAVTEAGTRCKHMKDGESDYCKQHSPDIAPGKSVEQCRAMTFEGTQCVRKPVAGSRYCRQHGGKEKQ